MMGWKAALSSVENEWPNPNSDTHHSFDPVFHTWESELYKRTQITPLPVLGRTREQQGPQSLSSSLEDEDSGLIYFNHSNAFRMLQSTKSSLVQDFFNYQQGWEAQINQAYCGVASSMAVMNSLRGKIILPQDPVYVPYPWATQRTLIQNECVRANVYDVNKMKQVFWGLGLDMATTLLNCHLQGQGYIATAHHVDPATSNGTALQLRSIFLEALKNEDTRIIINYDRGGITQGPMGHGHFSPIGAYNDEHDAFLVMDVAKYKYSPVWVPTVKLLRGIATMDSCASFTYPNKPVDILSRGIDAAMALLECRSMYRGYILVTKDDDHYEDSPARIVARTRCND